MLATLRVGHDNNLNLLRVVAASLVLVSHSYVLSVGTTAAEPLESWLGVSPGTLAVDTFFAVSGFLVTASMVGSRSLARFVTARALRIYPALWLALLLTMLAVGSGFTELNPQAFLSDPQTWRYLTKNALMFSGETELPGAFRHVPYADAVNGSLWTLRYELRMYALLALFWWVARRVWPDATRLAFGRMTLAVAGVLVAASVCLSFTDKASDFVSLGAMFFQGAALFILRGRVVIDWRYLTLMVLASALAWQVSTHAFVAVYLLCLPWAVLHLAFLPGGWLRRYNRVGDYSYGIYIFAFPIQQMAMATWPSLSPLGLMGAASPATLLLAVLSWHFVESHALVYKSSAALQLSALVARVTDKMPWLRHRHGVLKGEA